MTASTIDVELNALVGGLKPRILQAIADAIAAQNLHSAATYDASAFATASDGALARSAVQPAGLSGYVTLSQLQAQTAAIVGAAPVTLDTIAEVDAYLAVALGGDSNLAANIFAALAQKQPLSDVLTALAAITPSPDTIPYITPTGQASLTPLNATMRAVLAATSLAQLRMMLALSISDISGLGDIVSHAASDFASASAGTKIAEAAAINGLVKSNGAGSFTAATPGVDYVQPGSGGSATLVSIGLVTASLATEAVENGSVALGKSVAILRVSVDNPCRVRLYSTAANRALDSSRGPSSSASAGYGLIIDLVFSASRLSIDLSPCAIGANLDTSRSTAIYYSVQSLLATSATFSINFTALRFE